ncbi:hypothetical protein T09_6903 [Trichinella sp. T9]|nr:hypothetical protein T09_6903 [Trichinella sp. T9]
MDANKPEAISEDGIDSSAMRSPLIGKAVLRC